MPISRGKQRPRNPAMRKTTVRARGASSPQKRLQTRRWGRSSEPQKKWSEEASYMFSDGVVDKLFGSASDKLARLRSTGLKGLFNRRKSSGVKSTKGLKAASRNKPKFQPPGKIRGDKSSAPKATPGLLHDHEVEPETGGKKVRLYKKEGDKGMVVHIDHLQGLHDTPKQRILNQADLNDIDTTLAQHQEHAAKEAGTPIEEAAPKTGRLAREPLKSRMPRAGLIDTLVSIGKRLGRGMDDPSSRHSEFYEFMSPVGLKSRQKRPGGQFDRKNPPLPDISRPTRTKEPKSVQDKAHADAMRGMGQPVEGTSRSANRKVRKGIVEARERGDVRRTNERGWHWLDQKKTSTEDVTASEFNQAGNNWFPDEAFDNEDEFAGDMNIQMRKLRPGILKQGGRGKKMMQRGNHGFAELMASFHEFTKNVTRTPGFVKTRGRQTDKQYIHPGDQRAESILKQTGQTSDSLRKKFGAFYEFAKKKPKKPKLFPVQRKHLLTVRGKKTTGKKGEEVIGEMGSFVPDVTAEEGHSVAQEAPKKKRVRKNKPLTADQYQKNAEKQGLRQELFFPDSGEKGGKSSEFMAFYEFVTSRLSPEKKEMWSKGREKVSKDTSEAHDYTYRQPGNLGIPITKEGGEYPVGRRGKAGKAGLKGHSLRLSRKNPKQSVRRPDFYNRPDNPDYLNTSNPSGWGYDKDNPYPSSEFGAFYEFMAPRKRAKPAHTVKRAGRKKPQTSAQQQVTHKKRRRGRVTAGSQQPKKSGGTLGIKDLHDLTPFLKGLSPRGKDQFLRNLTGTKEPGRKAPSTQKSVNAAIKKIRASLPGKKNAEKRNAAVSEARKKLRVATKPSFLGSAFHEFKGGLLGVAKKVISGKKAGKPDFRSKAARTRGRHAKTSGTSLIPKRRHSATSPSRHNARSRDQGIHGRPVRSIPIASRRN